MAGPYIASPRIAPFLGQLGLLNDGHDILQGVRRYHAVNSNVATSAFSGWDGLVDANLDKGDLATCANSCHGIAHQESAPPSISDPGTKETLIPSITSVITEILMAPGPVMPPKRNTLTHYRWMNIDIPGDANTTGDLELFYPLKKNAVGTLSPTLNESLTCEIEPAYMEARELATGKLARTNATTLANTVFADVLEKSIRRG